MFPRPFCEGGLHFWEHLPNYTCCRAQHALQAQMAARLRSRKRNFDEALPLRGITDVVLDCPDGARLRFASAGRQLTDSTYVPSGLRQIGKAVGSVL